MNSDIPEQLTVLLNDLGDDDRSATARLLPLVYDELRALAGSFFANQRPDHTLQPTALVHEAYVRIVGTDNVAWNDRKHFFFVAAKVMRHVLADHARAHLSLKRGGDWQRVTIAQDFALTSALDLDLIALEDALSKLEGLHERQGRIVELRFLAGLDIQQVADMLGLSRRTIELEWRTAKAFLKRELSSADLA